MPVLRTVLANLARFILCAVPGAFLMLILPVPLLVGGIAPPGARAIEVAAGIAAVPIGAALILYGTNNWGKWGYVLPIVAIVPMFAMPHNVPTIVLIALLALPFVAAWAVRKYYRRRGQELS